MRPTDGVEISLKRMDTDRDVLARYHTWIPILLCNLGDLGVRRLVIATCGERHAMINPPTIWLLDASVMIEKTSDLGHSR